MFRNEWLNFFEPATSSGWTSYSPLSTTSTPATSFHISYMALANLFLPSLAELLIGSAMILFSKPVGSWLARGLKDDKKE
jgi:heme/copper-type cytochrome/quinol oxidase subunit 1